MSSSRPLRGIRVALTRPAGTSGALVRQVRALGGVPIRLPGSSLRAVADKAAASKALKIALACDIVIFTSPAAARFARKLAALHNHANLLAPGAGTVRALRRAGIADVRAPTREDSEGLLALPALRNVHGQRIGVAGATGGRGLLDRKLAARGATVLHAHVYRRLPARLDRRHANALLRDGRKPLYVLLSSAEALANILDGLADDACAALRAGTAVVSSGRIAKAARKAGFARVLRAGSAHGDDMLATIIADIKHGG